MEERIITFEGIGALFDDTPVYQMVEDEAFSHGLYDTRAVSLFQTYMERLKYAEPFRCYDDLIREALSYLDMEMGCEVFKHIAEDAVDLAFHLTPRAYAASTLRILKNSGYELALISAGSIDMTNEENRQLDQIFDYQLSSEEAESYAPERRLFEIAADRFSLYCKHNTYVTSHYWEGVMPASRAGWTKVWVHQDQMKGRKKEEPYGEVRSLKDLPLYFS